MSSNDNFIFNKNRTRKAKNDAEKTIIINESAKETSPDDIATKKGRHVYTVKKFQKDPAPREKGKKISDAVTSKAVSKRDLRNIGCPSGKEKTRNGKEIDFYRSCTSL